jgi:hypothetical protein
MSVPTNHPSVGFLTVQERFARNINLSQPEKSMASYQKFMHQNALEQVQNTTASSCSWPFKDHDILYCFQNRLHILYELNDSLSR